MTRVAPFLSRAMMLVGGLMILGAVAWGFWRLIDAPPPPVLSEAGAVVLAQTAVSTATPFPVMSPEPSPATTSTLPPVPAGPTPDLLPDWTYEQEPLEEEPSPTIAPTRLPAPTATPAPTQLPAADEPPSRIVAPAIQMDAAVMPMSWETVDRKGRMVAVWQVPKKAAGWHVNSALPGHGENVVLSGHHNIEGKVFRYVVDLEPGDEITLYAGAVPYSYVVVEKYILKEAGMPLPVRQKNAQWIMPSGDERLTLVTCWPYEWPGNTHRVIVVAKPVTVRPPSPTFPEAPG